MPERVTCPKCRADLRGQEIPFEYRDEYGNTTHYMRTIGMEVQDVYDGVLYYVCPDCNHAWVRDFGDWARLNMLSRTYANLHNQRTTTKERTR